MNELMSSVHEERKHSTSTTTNATTRNPHLSCLSKELADAYDYAKKSYQDDSNSTMKQMGNSLMKVGDNLNNSVGNTANAATQIQKHIMSAQNQQPDTVAEQALNTITGFVSYLFSPKT